MCNGPWYTVHPARKEAKHSNNQFAVENTFPQSESSEGGNESLEVVEIVISRKWARFGWALVHTVSR
jgi:hypothetical protein